MKYEQVAVSKLIPYVNNARKHSEEQVTKIASSIKEFGFVNPIIIDCNYGIIAGHGRLEAAKKLGLETVPCINAEHLTEAQRKAYVIADNRLAELAEWDYQLLNVELENLKELNFDLAMTGFDNLAIPDFQDGLISEEEAQETTEEQLHESMYTRKVEIPTYEPTRDVKPEFSEIVDTTKYDELMKEINNRSDITADERVFLQLAAARHIVFNYQNIAEYYAHSSKEVQDLMEKSALVIIDFDKAIANGFVKLSDQLAKQFSEDYPNGSEAESEEMDEEEFLEGLADVIPTEVEDDEE